ncbi:Actin-like protein arp9 (SWI/SNF complex component arp9) [Collariella sp. IMI 366227]|nr:Actin-like protein arp9 (SWI/SNF complex component arp9) [Collariella sp. IMI 366227]
MFRDEDSGDWRPYRTYKRKKEGTAGGEEEWEYVEDVDSAEGRFIRFRGVTAGRIANMDAFLAFLEHVHTQLTTTYHNTPIMLMASPQWTRPDCEAIARYVFEHTRTPALCLIHSGVATQYGLKWPNMTVVDVGFEKVDVTCIHDGRVVSHKDVGPVVGYGEEISGGEVFTRRLMKLLEGKGFDREMAEQLKQSPVCEVLPYAADRPGLMELPSETGPAVVAAVEGPKIVEPTKSYAPVGDENGTNGEGKEADDDGVLDVANIVASGQTREFLAKKEKEKAEKAHKAGRKGAKEAADAAAAKGRLPNSKRVKNTFHYEEMVTEEVPIVQPTTENGNKDATMGEAPTDGEASKAEQPQTSNTPTERISRRVRRDIEVGLERFQFADRQEIDRIVTAIYRAVQGIEDMYMRPGCWENIVFVGNGARVRGLRDNILQTLQARHLVSPSSATMFTSELPSNMGTPSGTGAQTPTSSFGAGPLPTAGGVNPLLQAATTAATLGMQGNANTPASNAGDPAAAGPSHHFHSQTPTNIRLAPLPAYLTEWSKHGFEEAMFLGAQVAARLAFCMHNLDAQGVEAQRLMSLSRVDYK